MVSYPQTDMKIPVRPAPAPPSNRPTAYQRSPICFDSWDDVNDPFSNGNISRSFTNIKSMQTVKKKPPPRPPPPRISNNVHQSIKQNKSNVLSNLFSKSNRHSSLTASTSHKQIVSKDHNVVVASLIDFDSPSSSPTFTTRSSSDGVSVNSFGSDGSASNNGNTPSGGTSSLFESGFEDDFDFFGGLSSNNVKTPNTFDNQDPWSMDSFSPSPPQKHEGPSLNSGNPNWFNDLAVNENSVKTASNPTLMAPPAASARPTIIRSKPSRPSTLPKPLQILQLRMNERKQTRESVLSVKKDSDITNIFPDGAGDESREGSPPMPSVPPPPPPVNVDTNDIPLVLPDLPPRNSFMNKIKTPHGIAIYDYSTSHPDDLVFKSNDLIHLLKKINNEWFYGEVGDRRGMFPANFIEIIVPLDEKQIGSGSPETVTALYPFPAQQWDDLAFPDGAVIKVLGQINADWLYGEYQGKTGQFPSSFVDHIPSGLPQRKI